MGRGQTIQSLGHIFQLLAKGVGRSDPSDQAEEGWIELIDGMDFTAPFAPLVRLGEVVWSRGSTF